MERPLISLFRTDDVRSIDSAAIASGVSGYELMTRAAVTSLDLVRERYADVNSLLVLCGAGNNAGDGYVLARLAREAGLAVTVCAASAPERLKGDAAQAWRDYEASCNLADKILEDFEAELLSRCDLVVDALLGTGLNRPVDGTFAHIISCVNEAPVSVVSLDVPSGLNSDTGLPQPIAVKAQLTVTFIALKPGLYTGQSMSYCGQIECRNLGVSRAIYEPYVPVARVMSEKDARAVLPRRAADSHKGQHGRVLVVGGNVGMPGAVALTAEAALRSGAGTVTVACHAHNRAIVAGHLAEVMCVGVEHPDELGALIDGCDVIALGPGMGRGLWGSQLFNRVVQSSGPMVIDADALRLLAGAAHSFEEQTAILTPHPGEAGELLGVDSAAIQADRFGSAQSLAKQYHAVTALKGAGTIVASSSTLPAICSLGNPGMATAGSGDVLTGLIAGIWAQQRDRHSCAADVASAGVYVHAMAGDRAAAGAERGVIASDLLKHVRHCVNFDL